MGCPRKREFSRVRSGPRFGCHASPFSETTTYEAGKADEVRQILSDAGVTVLDGDSCELQGVGFAGVKGFCGGFGRGALGPWGEEIIKSFVREAVNEAFKLESALARLRGTASGRAAALLADPRQRSKASRWKSSRTSVAVGSKSRSRGIR